MRIYTIEHSVILRECRRSKGKRRGKPSSRYIAEYADFISTKWSCSREPLLRPEKCRLGQNIATVEHVLYVIGDLCELLAIIGIESDVDREMEILL